MFNPKITVLMTVYNGMPYLPKAIESILGQTWEDFEFLIVNDASTDNSREVIQSYDDPRIRLLDNPVNMGQTKSLNRGLEHIHTEIVARLDADDISHPDRLEKQIVYLKSHPEVVVVGTNIRWIDHRDKVVGQWIRPKDDVGLRWFQIFTCPIGGGLAMFRRSVIWDKLGGFNPAIRIAQDWELWSRLPLQYKLANLSEPLVDVRMHPNASTIMFNGILRAENEIIKRQYRLNILGNTIENEQLLNKAEALIKEGNGNPKYRLDFIEGMFRQFCILYPMARKNKEILMELSHQYLSILSYTDYYSLPAAFKVLRLAWPVSSKKFYVSGMARWLAVCMVRKFLRNLKPLV